MGLISKSRPTQATPKSCNTLCRPYMEAKERLSANVRPVPTALNRKDPSHPRNWPISRKVYDTSLLISIEYITTLISNTGCTAAAYAHKDLRIGMIAAIAAFTSSYLVGQSWGSIIFPPFTETFGRKKTYIVSTLLYAIASAVTGAAAYLATGDHWKLSLAVIVASRFTCGFLSSIPSVVIVGSIEEMWSPRARIWPIQGWVGVSINALSVAPAIALHIIDAWDWKRLYFVAAVIVGVQTFLLLFIKESRTHHAGTSGKLNNSRNSSMSSEESLDNKLPRITFRRLVQKTCVLPIRLFFTELLICLVSIMSATVFSLLYLFTEAIPVVYKEFGYTERQCANITIIMAIGVVFSFLVRMKDQCVANESKKQRRELTPEDKLLGFFIAAPIYAIALWGFAWTVRPLVKFPSWVSMLFLVPIGFAANEFDHVLTGYLTDVYGPISGSANAPLAFLRASMSAVFPLVGGKMYCEFGSNKAGSILAVVATAFCAVAILFALRGRQMREGSKWVKMNQEIVERRHGRQLVEDDEEERSSRERAV